MDDAIARDLEKIQFETQIQAFLIEDFCFINKHNFLMFIDVYKLYIYRIYIKTGLS